MIQIYQKVRLTLLLQALIKHNDKVRPFLLTRSTFVGSGTHAGHWTGDNHSKWNYLKISIANVLSMQIFGVTYSGADVCGFNGDTTEELCARWLSIGAMYSFARSHNAIGQIDQEPYLWENTAEAARRALSVRYTLLPYLYTISEESHRLGTGFWRALFFEYPEFEELSNNDVQPLIGTDILLSPVLDEGKTTVDAQFPKGIWYDWYNYEAIEVKSGVKTVTLDAPIEHLPVHIRGGAIIPTKTPKYTTGETYETDYNLVIALDKNNKATGRLYVDDGKSLHVESYSDITFEFKNNKLTASGKFGYKKTEKLSKITIVGASAAKITSARDGKKDFKLSHANGTAVIENANIDLTAKFSINFKQIIIQLNVIKFSM